MDGRIFNLRKRLLENLQNQWTIDEMAAIVRLSKPHLQRLFKTEAGMSPIAYLHDLRLERASELLVATFRRVSEISYEVGLLDDSHFTRDFKKKFGVPPTEYRKRQWEKIQTDEFDGQK